MKSACVCQHKRAHKRFFVFFVFFVHVHKSWRRSFYCGFIIAVKMVVEDAGCSFYSFEFHH